MNERQYLKKKRQLELADAAMRLQQQFSPEQEARDRLLAEQARAAYYNNEAFRQTQPYVAREQAARVAMLEDDARNYSAKQALLNSEQALRNAGVGQDVALGNKTFNPRVRSAQELAQQQAYQTQIAGVDARYAEPMKALGLNSMAVGNAANADALAFQQRTADERARSIALQNRGQALQNVAGQFQNDRLENTQQIYVDQQRAAKDYAIAQALAQQTQAKLGVRTMEDDVNIRRSQAFHAANEALLSKDAAETARRTQEARVSTVLEQPSMARNQNAANRAQLAYEEERLRQARESFPAQQARAEAEAIQAMRLAGTGLGAPRTELNKEGKEIQVPTDIDPRVMLSRPGYQQMQRMLENGAAGQAPGAVPPDVQRTFTELSNPDLRARLFDAVTQNRKFTTTPEPGTVQLGQEFARAYEVMDQAPLANWPIEGQALQLIRQNPEKFGMYRFDPALISAEDFAQALEMVRPANYTEQPLLPPPAVSIYPKWMGLTPQYTR